MIQTNDKITFNGSTFQGTKGKGIGITPVGKFLVNLGSDDCGSYFTVIPISPREYRKTYYTLACAKRAGHSILVHDDGGVRYTIEFETSSDAGKLMAELENDGHLVLPPCPYCGDTPMRKEAAAHDVSDKVVNHATYVCPLSFKEFEEYEWRLLCERFGSLAEFKNRTEVLESRFDRTGREWTIMMDCLLRIYREGDFSFGLASMARAAMDKVLKEEGLK